MINHFRIDDRLIHGQIITVWLRESKASMIVVADDFASSDPTQKMLLKFATPKDIKLEIVSLEKTKETLDKIKEGVLLLVRNPEGALKLLKSGVEVDSINVGNISDSNKGGPRKTLKPFLHLSEKDSESLKEINKLGVELDVRSVPTDRKFNILEKIGE